MKIETIFCDCCKQEIKNLGRWENKPWPFEVVVTTDCQNPLGYLDEKPGFQGVHLKLEHVCLACATGLAKVTADFIQKRRGVSNIQK